jgi:hypothetical protein
VTVVYSGTATSVGIFFFLREEESATEPTAPFPNRFYEPAENKSESPPLSNHSLAATTHG